MSTDLPEKRSRPKMKTSQVSKDLKGLAGTGDKNANDSKKTSTQLFPSTKRSLHKEK